MLEDKKQMLFMEPVCTHNIWGGSRLKDEFGYSINGDDIGECWGISAHPNGDGTIKNGVMAGKKLSEVWKEYPEMFGNLSYDRFPLLTKIIDAREDLSIQVHPDDAYAKVHENGSFGKMECWYIIDCKENATIVVGHNARNHEELEQMIQQGKWNDFIREIPIHAGDFIQIDPGTVHAIKGGTLLLETQQNSDITYRVYDYDRLSDGKKRPLHIEQSIDVITVPAKKAEDSIRTTTFLSENKFHLLYECQYYSVFKMLLVGEKKWEQKYPFFNISIVEGNGQIDGISVKKGDHLILPNHYGEVILQGEMEIIASTAH